MAFIGLDVGTSGCKAAAYSRDGTCIGQSERGYSLITPEKGFAELDPLEIWNGVQEVLRELAPCCDGDDWLAISGIGESFVLLDDQGAPLSRFITYLDSRGDAELEEIRAEIPEEELYRRTGVRLNRTYSICKLQWLRNHRPEAFARADRVVFFNEYFNYMLTGKHAVDPGVAIRSMLVRPDGRAWEDRVLRAVGLREEQMAPILPIGTPLGGIRPELCRSLGLPGTLTVVLGCHDQCAASLGAGIWEPGDMVLGEGSSEGLNLVVSAEDALPDEDRYRAEIVAEPYLEGKYLLLAAQSAFCTSLKWFLNLVGEGEESEDRYAYWDARCAEDTNVLFIPHLSGLNVMRSDAPASGAFLGLHFSTGRDEMYRAVLEGMHMETRRILEGAMLRRGIPLKKLVVAGGNSRSARSMQIKADVLERELVTLEQLDAGTTGLAVICAVASGACGDYASAIDRFVTYGKVYAPSRSIAAKYRRYLVFTDAIPDAELKFMREEMLP